MSQPIDPKTATEPVNQTRKEQLLATLCALMAEALPAMSASEDIHVPFVEMGANSLILMEIQRTIENRFGLTIVVNQLFEELSTIAALATFIDENLPLEDCEIAAESADQQEPVRGSLPPVGLPTMALPELPVGNIGEVATELEQILTQQLTAASAAISKVVAQQLEFLQTSGLTTANQVTANPSVAANVKQAAASTVQAASSPVSQSPVANKPASKKPQSAVSHQHLLSPLEIRARGLNQKQQQHLEALIKCYTERTKTSKQLTQQYRSVLADSRACVGFRFTTKEMLYPIIGKRAAGARIWDVDDNEYVDITMGQGVTLFGHHPAFIEDALAAEPKDVVQLGPRAPNAGEAARLLAEFTGFERVTFTNSGTEAVMAALRLARAATGCNKIVQFENSYHGHSDSTTARPDWQDGVLKSIPIAPGTPPGAVEDLWLLEYGSETSLEFIRVHAKEIAAVLVEPVQSRRPDLQPREFVRELRKITERLGILLIFDEMITGFRFHPGGAQAWFGVKADIATYGKVVAGGMPIGAVAGSAKIMDGIDGGMWQYGDASYPQATRVGFGGTFCQHPLTMTTTLATLRYLKAQGPALQEGLNQKTERLAKTLNAYFEQRNVPIEVVYFGSLFRFAFSTNLELLFYHLMVQGVFIWEWRNYFLSTAHTNADVDFIINAVKASIEAMIEGGFIAAEPAGKDVADEEINPQQYDNEFPLTEAQKQLWTLAKISEAGSIAYNLCVVLELHGSFDLAAMQRAIQLVFNRHDALRTVIKNQNLQEVMSSHQLDVALVDLTQSHDLENAVQSWLNNVAKSAFDLAKGPLFAAVILKLADQRHHLVLRGHHIIVDGLSMNVIVAEIGASYSAFLNQQTPELSLQVQFGKYVQWQQTEACNKHEYFWLKKLSGVIPVLNLPTDHKHPPIKTYRGGRATLFVRKELCERLSTLSQKQGCTPFMIFFAVYALWIHRLTGQDDIVVAIPVAGRPAQTGFDKLVGYCTHLLPICSQINWENSFLSFLKTTRGVLLEGYRHQEYPFAHLINKLTLQRDGSHALLISTLFNLDRPGTPPPMGDLKPSWKSPVVNFTAFDLVLNMTEVADEMILECDYNSDVFEQTTVARFVGHFHTLLTEVANNFEMRVDHLPLLSATEQRQLLIDWNNTQVQYPHNQCLHHLFEIQVANHPTVIAAVYKEQQLTYASLNQRANQLAHYLQTQAVGPEVIVGICVARSFDMIVAILGVLKAGGAYLPMDPSYPASRLGFMLADAKVPVLLTQQHLLDKFNFGEEASVVRRHILCLDTDWQSVAVSSSGNPVTAVRPDNLAYIIYTSGSTGQPKGTMIEHASVVNYLSWCIQFYRVGNGCGAPIISSIGFDATITSVFSPLLAAQRILLVAEEQEEIAAIKDAVLSANHWSLIKITPAHLELLNAVLTQETITEQTDVIVFGGDALFCSSLSWWRDNAPNTRLINEYGPTETVVGCCIFEVTKDTPRDGAVPIGRPIANTELYVLDQALQPLPIGVPGELYIGGRGVARGYLNREQLSAEKFITNPFGDGRLYKTGDLVRYLPDGNLVYLGRMDNQVKIRGFRVEPGEIEALLIQHTNVQESLVVVHEFAALDMRLLAYVVAPVGQAIDEVELRRFVTKQLPDYMRPSVFISLAAMPLTANGKIDRKALPLPDSLRPQLEVSFVSPQTDAEKIIAQSWQDILQIEKVGVNDNFFDLGGHSLLVISLSERLTDKFKRPVTAIDLFRYPTIRSLAGVLADNTDAGKVKVVEIQKMASRQKQSYRQQRNMRNQRKR